MLRSLSIRDFVIVDHLELEFDSGFGALTGETGAGKSILLDALGLALGGRGEVGMVRRGRERADVVAVFDLPETGGLRAWLVEHELPQEEGSVLLRRTIDASGRSRAWINGTSVTLAQLRAAGDWLADIHGQHAHHALLRPDAQRQLLDTHAGARVLAGEVAEHHREWQRIVRLRAEAEVHSASSERERELLTWQLRELDQLGFDATEWGELNAEHGRLAHAAGLIEGADETLATLGEGGVAVCSTLRHLDSRVAALSDIDPTLAEVRDLLSSAAIQADEALHALRRYRDRLDLDPQRLAEIESRIAVVTDVARKYRVAVDTLPALREQWQARLDTLEATADPARLAADEARALHGFEEAAAKLSVLRQPAAAALSAEITEAMQTLAMPGGRFEVALECCEPSSAGVEEVEFRVAANPGQALRSMAKVASGGELSRIGLAIQVMTSRASDTPTLIFDEVDVGIGGRVAEIVGKLLARLGESRQVMCVTHLAQVAACADWQWQISKREQAGETLSEVQALNSDQRVEELARMLGGVNITARTREHAAEMLGLSVPGR
ncbi:MAG TPA: DNA repair protein RecN [Thauera sp.]|nr:DNA repair protein RecN [Thauera sp.]HRA80595.1 DNA repair protein RecN [Thauera sp.]